MSFASVLFLIFLVLKLTGVIAWSWWWVTCPLWIGFAIWLVMVFIITSVKTSMQWPRP